MDAEEEDKCDTKCDIPNPWDVENASVFLKYNCPECDQKCQNLSDFKDHAIQNHEKAKVLFTDQEIKNDPLELDIKVDEPLKKKRKRVTKKRVLDEDQVDQDPDFSDIETLHAEYKNEKWSCSECGFDQVEHKFDLVDHWLDHHNFKSINYEVCHYCTIIFNNHKSYVKHCGKDHPQVPMLRETKCQLCDFSSNNRSVLVQHYSKDHEQEYVQYQCNICQEKFTFEQQFLRHQQIKHSIEVKKLKCDTCDTLIYGHTNILVHQASHKFIELYFCKHCDYSSVTKVELIVHHKAHHDRLLPPYFKCDKCDFISRYNATTISHAKEQHNSEYNAFECKTCGWTKNNLTQMLKHMEVHERNRGHVCNYCGKKLRKLASLQFHIATVHEADKSKQDYVCDICGYTTYHSFWLKKHVFAKHSKEKHTKCYYCDETFAYKANMEVHVDRKHPEKGNKVHFCTVCDKGFIYAYSLKFHMHSHKERHHSKVLKIKSAPKQQINCELCGEEICSSKIRWHYKKYHPEKIDQSILLKCDHCHETFLDKMGLKKHMYNSHGDSQGSKVCEKCKLPYSQRHTCPAGKASRLQCHLCERSFCDKKKLQAHIIGDHEKRKDYKCEYCSKAFALDFQRKSHIRQVHDNVNCELCKKTLSCEYELRRHMVFVHQETKGAFLCDICPKKVFFSIDKFRLHMNQVHLNSISQI